jgi:hypothetical protein
MHSKFFQLLLGLLFLGMIACTKSEDKESFIGPQDITTPTNFKVENDSLYAAFPLVSFSENKQFFLARFSHKVKWILEIKGLQSGASKTIEGISQNLDSVNSQFSGDGEGIPFFLPGEMCKANLKIPGHERSYETRFSINLTKTMDCFVIDDFENPGSTSGFTSWEKDDADSNVVASRNQGQKFLEGKAASHFAGKDSDGNYWIAYSETQTRNWTSYLEGKSADRLYINGFALDNANGNTRLEIQILEDENGDGQFNSSQDEIYKKQVSLGDAWLGFSLLYSDFEKANTAGNGGKEPAKILKIRMILITVPAGAFAEAWVDFVNFTYDKPFSQK